MRRRELPERLAARAPWAYKASYNKFYMDEFYNAAVIRPVMGFAMWLWAFVDVRVIDGAVNGVAFLVKRSGARVRRIEAGRVQLYQRLAYAGLLVVVIVVLLLVPMLKGA